MPKIELTGGAVSFVDNKTGLTLDVYKPQADVAEITEHMRFCISGGILRVVPPEETENMEQDEEEDGDEQEETTDKVRPTTKVKCKAKGKSGARCRRNALKYSTFCIQHISAEELAEVDKKLEEETGG